MSTQALTKNTLSNVLPRVQIQRGFAFGLIILVALLAFELFNYSTTEYALADLLGDLKFLGVRWATILTIAFCGIDFAGIARLFSPQKDLQTSGNAWYLFGAWLLAATMNAMLTWWGVSLAVLNHETLGNAVIERQVLLRVVPIFVAVMIWLIRVLLIGSFSVASDRLLKPSRPLQPRPAAQPRTNTAPSPVRSFRNQTQPQSTISASPKRPTIQQPIPSSGNGHARPEPTYHSLSMSPGKSTKTIPMSYGEQQSSRPEYRD